jgi:hypothetical protein
MLLAEVSVKTVSEDIIDRTEEYIEPTIIDSTASSFRTVEYFGKLYRKKL